MSKKIKVVHVISGTHIGGAERMLQKIVRYTDKSCFDVEIISLNGMGVIGRELVADGIAVHAFSLNSKHFFSSLIAIARLLRKLQPDIVQTWMYHGDFFGGVLAKICTKAKIIWGVRVALHGKQLERRSTWALALLNALLSYFVPDVIISNSLDGRDTHIRFGYAKNKFILLPNGFETERFKFNSAKREEVRAQWQVNDQEFVIGMAGRYAAQKDWSTFLKLINELRKKNLQVKAIICGLDIDDENRDLIENIDKLDNKDSVILLGPLTNMIDYYCGLDLFVLTSLFEGFPNVVGEALAIGIPCVVTDAGDCRELVDDRYVAPCGEVSTLGVMCQMIIDMDKYRLAEHKEKLAKSLREKYDIKNIVIRQQDIYVNLMREKDKHRRTKND
ncbi:MAG: glycosyltransferase [Bacillota bacterium]